MIAHTYYNLVSDLMPLTSKTLLITGATSGFGAATARLVVAKGARVVITGRRNERLQALREELGAEKAHALCFDVRDKEAVGMAMASIPDAFRPIDALINNAGLALNTAPAQEVPLGQWEQMIDTNINGLLYMTRAILPEMLARDAGHIVNIGSMAGNYPYPGGNVYGASKAFVKQFSLNLRADLLGTGIRVTNLEPGLAETEFSEVRLGDKDKAADVYKGTEPLKAEDIAQCILFVLTLPPHVNVNRMEIMPACQASGPLVVHRN